MVNEQSNSSNPNVTLQYRRKKNAVEMKHQVITFAMMIFFTLLAFTAVGLNGISHWFTKPIIILLAFVQVVFQLYYFMHMKHKGHGMVSLFLFAGLLFGMIMILTFSTIVWI